MSLKIATWNVNSVRARIANITSWLEATQPDVLCLQEIKCETSAFPALEFQALGYECAVSGQKAYHGVALLSKKPLSNICLRLPGDPGDEQARYVEALVDNDVRVASLYLPNGNGGDEKLSYKHAWMDRMHAHAKKLLATPGPLVLAGDWNVIPEDEDCDDPGRWQSDALFIPETRQRFAALKNLGLRDAFRLKTQGPGHYSFWDYQGGAWQKDEGIRIDHLLLSASAADRLESCHIDRSPRGETKASDHTPVIAKLGPEPKPNWA